MKGVLMKAGQMVSFIAEGLPDEAQQALAALQADAAPMAPSLAAAVIESELGAAPERVFATWEDMPVAAASIGQVHRARDAAGRELAVKVQFPGVAEAIEEDLDAAEVMYAMFSALALNGLDARALVDELRAADARGARLPPRGRQHRRVRRPLRRPSVGAHPDAGPGVLDVARCSPPSGSTGCRGISSSPRPRCRPSSAPPR